MIAPVVYFIQSGDAGPIKIGFTSGCPLDRMANLQTGCPDELRLVAHARGTADDERELHKRFAHLRLRGEWFQAKPELVEFIRGIRFAKRDDPPLERAHQPMIGDLGREDLEHIAAYVELRHAEQRVESALIVASTHNSAIAEDMLRKAYVGIGTLIIQIDDNVALSKAADIVGRMKVDKLYADARDTYRVMRQRHASDESDEWGTSEPDDASHFDEPEVH